MASLQRVLDEPGSIAARRALAAAGDPRKALIEKQLALRELQNVGDFASPRALRLDDEVTALIASQGKAFAGRVADLVESYRFYRGLVAQVRVTPAQWKTVAKELMTLAPIQHLDLFGPMDDLAAALAMPETKKLVTLSVSQLGAAFGDAGAIALARSPNAANLRWIDLVDDAIGEPGVEAIAASPYLEHARYIAFDRNPCDPTPVVDDYDGVRTPRRPPVAAELERSYGKRPWLALPTEDPWPPRRDEVAVTA